MRLLVKIHNKCFPPPWLHDVIYEYPFCRMIHLSFTGPTQWRILWTHLTWQPWYQTDQEFEASTFLAHHNTTNPDQAPWVGLYNPTAFSSGLKQPSTGAQWSSCRPFQASTRWSGTSLFWMKTLSSTFIIWCSMNVMTRILNQGKFKMGIHIFYCPHFLYYFSWWVA